MLHSFTHATNTSKLLGSSGLVGSNQSDCVYAKDTSSAVLFFRLVSVYLDVTYFTEVSREGTSSNSLFSNSNVIGVINNGVVFMNVINEQTRNIVYRLHYIP